MQPPRKTPKTPKSSESRRIETRSSQFAAGSSRFCMRCRQIYGRPPPMTSATSIYRICGNKSLLGYPDYVIVSLRRQAFDTDKRTAAAAAAAEMVLRLPIQCFIWSEVSIYGNNLSQSTLEVRLVGVTRRRRVHFVQLCTAVVVVTSLLQ